MSRNLQVLNGERLNIVPGEHILETSNGVDVELRIPPTVSGPKRTENAKGRLWLTDRRVVFSAELTPAAGSSVQTLPPTGLTSLEIPYGCIQACSFQLPIFGANHLLISFLPATPSAAGATAGSDPSPPPIDALPPSLPHPGRGGKLEVKVVFADGAGHGMWKRIEGERTRVAAQRRGEEQLPVYTPH